METAKRTDTDSVSYWQRGPGGEILRLLQRNGPMSIKQLQAALGVRSANAVREQLMSLTGAGLIQTRSVRGAAGRPANMYALSDKAQALFPKGYDVLLKLVLEELVAQEGRERLKAILAGVSARLAAEYGASNTEQGLEQRLVALAAAFDARGMPITIVEHDDVLELHGYSCPYFNVAQETGDVCAVEQQMLEQVLGRKVRLTQRMVDGHVGCQFVIDGGNQAASDSSTAK